MKIVSESKYYDIEGVESPKVTLVFPAGWFNNEDEMTEDVLSPFQNIIELFVLYMSIATSNKDLSTKMLYAITMFLDTIINYLYSFLPLPYSTIS